MNETHTQNMDNKQNILSAEHSASLLISKLSEIDAKFRDSSSSLVRSMSGALQATEPCVSKQEPVFPLWIWGVEVLLLYSPPCVSGTSSVG